MCRSTLHGFIQALPKVEHHIHLEGALEPGLLFTLAAQNGVSLPKDDEAFSSEDTLLARYRRFTSLDDFLHYYYIGMSVLRTTSDFEALAWHYFQRSFRDGVKHAEVFFDPQAHLSRGIQYSVLLQGFLRAKENAESQLGMTVHIIACFLRHIPVSDSLSVFDQNDVQQSFADGQVIGVGIDSSEIDYPPENFSEIFRKAGAMHLHRTAHAGEEAPATYIEGALDHLEVERIDHGVRLAEDPVLMKRVADESVMLTLCPKSNVLLRCVDAIEDVPIRKFLEAGVKFSINSDDPAYFSSYILDNYCAVQDAFQLDEKEWRTICANSIEGSWCSDDRKSELLIELDTVCADWDARA